MILLAWKTSDDQLKFKILCNEKSVSSLWKCRAECVVRLRSLGLELLERKFRGEFDYSTNFIEDVLGDWRLIKEYILQCKYLTIEAIVKIQQVTGIRKRKIIDYSAEKSELFNATLIVEGQKVHVNKQLLAMHSKFFETLFFGQFSEKNQDCIELQDVKHAEFLEFLDVVHPTHASIDEDNVERLLELADRFQTDEVSTRCEEFLARTKNVPMAKKLILAHQYTLDSLMDTCLKSFNSLEDMIPLRRSEYFHHLDDNIKSILLELLVRLEDSRMG
uniref:BTB domain-containing protein n=1 Tax=Caenorhabditis japonica TaxID=281687 RepID=A0A8R1I1F8_CAEJA